MLTTDTQPRAAGRLAEWKLAPRRRRLERRAPVPGRPLRDRDGVPAPRVRGVRPQGAAGDQPVRAVRLHPDRRQPGHHGRVRPRGLPLRPLDADRHDPADQRRRRRAQRHRAVRRVPQPGGLPRRRERRTADLGRGRRLDHHGPVRPGRPGDRRVRRRDPAQQPAGPAARPAGAQHGAGPQRGHPAAERRAPADLRRDQRRPAEALHRLGRLRAAAQAPGVPGELRRGLRDAPDHHRPRPPPTGKRTAADRIVNGTDPARPGRHPQPTIRAPRSTRAPTTSSRPTDAGRLHVRHRRLGEHRRQDRHRRRRHRPVGRRPRRAHQPVRRPAGQHLQLRVREPADQPAER